MTDRTFPTPNTPPALKRKDFVSDQMVRWCPGCGDFAILAQVQKTLPTLGIPKEKIVFISGIGCSSRFPYYMDTYGFHTIHGRAPTFATGLKCARPDLQVWVVTGDGDGLSIGGNHLMHALRRNIDINILLFNNRIYGLTKGQYSPTSHRGKVSKSSPAGSIDRPIFPLRTALAAEATFVARAVDSDVVHLASILERAAKHKGTSFVEIYQNCIVFNDGVFEDVESRATRDDFALKLEHGKPMIYGKDRDRGIRMKDGITPEIVTFKPENPPKDLLVHNENAGAEFAYMLTHLEPPEFPTPVGVFRSVEEATYNDLLDAQIESAKKPGANDLSKLIAGAENWEVAK
ncbi:MAG: 2-oxoacid:ferredoxin oxidoreductase subunit beta [Elusimicrobia bacterium]|nr:MAG: 2-oxoacid:ferredoxin oxidoreductase subunit beta [Elusimicrobiota bacterium]